MSQQTQTIKVKRTSKPLYLRNNRKTPWQKIKRHWQLYFLILLPLATILIFSYVPMYGILLAFKDYEVTKGILGSDSVGFAHFQRFFDSYYFERLIKNTLYLSLYGLIASFPLPIILAVAINECRFKRFARSIQIVTYAPYFISTVVLVSMIMLVLSPRTGLVNHFLELVGGTRVNFMAQPDYFRHVYVWSGIWQGTGFSSVIYIAALAGVDRELHEAATVDGANRFKRVLHIDLPSILPTIIILLILSTGSIMSVGYEKVLLMQNDLNRSASDIISTHVYELGLLNREYGYSTAVGLFNSLINLVIIFAVNIISKRVSEVSLW